MNVSALGKPEGCKLLRIRADLSEPLNDDSIVLSISIHGDFFAIPEDSFEALEEGLAGSLLKDVPAAFDSLVEKMRIHAIGITGKGIYETIRKAIDGISFQAAGNRQ